MPVCVHLVRSGLMCPLMSPSKHPRDSKTKHPDSRSANLVNATLLATSPRPNDSSWQGCSVPSRSVPQPCVCHHATFSRFAAACGPANCTQSTWVVMTMVSSHTLDHAAHGLGKNRGYPRVPRPGSNMTNFFNSRLIDRPSLVYTGMPLA